MRPPINPTLRPTAQTPSIAKVALTGLLLIHKLGFFFLFFFMIINAVIHLKFNEHLSNTVRSFRHTGQSDLWFLSSCSWPGRTVR